MPIQTQSAPDNRQPEEARPGNIKYTTPAFEDIRKDLNSLQSDVAHLAADIRKTSSEKAQGVIASVNDYVGSLKDTGASAVGKIEDNIRSKPGQSITIAFVTGLLASYLLSRRS